MYPISRPYVACFATYWVVLLNGWCEILRFASPLANYLVMFAAQTIPVVLILLGLRFQVQVARWINTLLLLPLLLLSAVTGSCAVLAIWDIATTGKDPSFERVRSIPVAQSQLILYRTNGGALTSDGLVVRHERTLIRGLLLVRRLRSFYPAHDAEVIVLAPDTVRLKVEPDRQVEWRPEEAELKLKRFVYF